MITGLPYIIKAQICFALLWVTYRLFIEKGKAFSMSRAYLLCSAVLAFLLPLVSVPAYLYGNNTATYVNEAFEDVFLQAVVVGQTAADGGFDMRLVFVCIAIAVSTALFLRMIVNIAVLRILSRKGRKEKSEGVNIIYTSGSSVAFSLFNNIYINTRQLRASQIEQVLAHELCHVRLGHSWDMMLSALMRIFFWWNPFVWLWSRSLVEVHEFQADEAVLNNGSDQAQYINLITQKLADRYPGFASGFSYSLIKKRLKMITKNSRSRFAGLRILSVLPVALLLPALFSCAEKTVNSQEGAPVEISVAEELPIEEAVAINVVEARSEQKAPERPIKVETMPEFPGGDKALKKFLEQNVKFPESLRDSETKDVVMVRFTVDETGKVMGVHSVDIGKPVNELFKEEAIRVVKSMPKWIPGSHEGKLVSVLIQQDIKFVNTKKPSPSGNQTEAIAEPRVLDNNPE